LLFKTTHNQAAKIRTQATQKKEDTPSTIRQSQTVQKTKAKNEMYCVLKISFSRKFQGILLTHQAGTHSCCKGRQKYSQLQCVSVRDTTKQSGPQATNQFYTEGLLHV